MEDEFNPYYRECLRCRASMPYDPRPGAPRACPSCRAYLLALAEQRAVHNQMDMLKVKNVKDNKFIS